MYSCYIKTKKEEGKDFISYELRDVKTGNPFEIDEIKREELWKQDKLADHSFVMDELRKVVGGVLTIIDASISDKRQNKAIKDLVRNLVSDSMTHTTDLMVDQRRMQEMIDEIPEEELDTIETVDVLEAVGIEEEKR